MPQRALGPARADDAGKPAADVPLGLPGQLVISATRLVPLAGVNSWNVRTSSANDGPSGTEIETGNHPSSLTVYDIPRLGFDWLPVARLTLGFDVGGYATLGGGAPVGDPSYVSIVELAPRVGYVAPLGDVVSVWLRAGVVGYVLNERGIDGSGVTAVPWSFTWKQLDADLEVHLVIAVFSHMAMTAGAIGELPLAGSFDETRSGGHPGVQASAAWLHIGVTGGLLAYL